MTRAQIEALVLLMKLGRVNPGRDNWPTHGGYWAVSPAVVAWLIRNGYAQAQSWTDPNTGAPRVSAVRPVCQCGVADCGSRNALIDLLMGNHLSGHKVRRGRYRPNLRAAEAA